MLSFRLPRLNRAHSRSDSGRSPAVIATRSRFEAAVLYLKEVLAPKDILLTLGAGDVWKLGEMVLEEI